MDMPDLSGFPFKLADILRRIVNAINGCKCQCPYVDANGNWVGYGSGGKLVPADPIDSVNPIAGPEPYAEIAVTGNMTLGTDMLNRILYLTPTAAGYTVSLPEFEKGAFIKPMNVGSYSVTVGTTLIAAGAAASLIANASGGIYEESYTDPGP